MRMKLSNSGNDDYQTPPYALNILFPYLPKEWIIWECACGEGNLIKTLEGAGYQVYGSDIKTGVDFLNKVPEHEFDCVLTNPPYTLKGEFLYRAYRLNKPFAFLLPVRMLEIKLPQKLFKEFGIEIIIPNKRINYIPINGQKDYGSWFPTAWFTWKFNIGKELLFVELDRKEITHNERELL